VKDASVIDTDALINSRKIGGLQWLVGALGAAALLVEGFNTSAIGYIQPQITKAWSLPPNMVGTILNADMVGLLLGYLLIAPLSARFGHRRMVLVCTAAFGALTFLTMTAADVTMLIAFRFLTGIGVGGAMPSAVALVGEYFPERVRSTSVTLVYVGFSLGQIAAGVVSGLLLEAFSWRAVLAFGGVVTLILTALFSFLLPESLEYLINRGGARRHTVKILCRLAPEIAISDQTRLVAGAQGGRKVMLRQLLEDGRAPGTILSWIGMFASLMIYFFMQKWLPSLLVQVGLTQGAAITATTVGLAGGIVAAFIIGPLMDRFGPYAVVSGLFAFAALSVILMAYTLTTPAPGILTLMSLLIGFCLSGGQKANNALSVYFYPTALRGPGLGWGLGIGRIGGVIGISIAGSLLSEGWSPSGLFYAAALPCLIGALAIAAMGHIYGHNATRAALASGSKA
jgi:AAHS family 4-hydroxybenzoate transporter-like MFS transporter